MKCPKDRCALVVLPRKIDTHVLSCGRAKAVVMLGAGTRETASQGGGPSFAAPCGVTVPPPRAAAPSMGAVAPAFVPQSLPSTVPARPPASAMNGASVPAAGQQQTLDSAALLAYQQVQQQAYEADNGSSYGPSGQVLPQTRDLPTEVKSFAARFSIEDQLQNRLLEALRKRGDKWEADLKDFTACLSRARSPAGFLIVKLSDLEKAIAAETGANPAKPRELCADYRRGACTRGVACRFSHDVPTGLDKNNFAKLIAQAQQSTSSGFSSGGFSASSAPNPAPAEGFGERRKEMLQNGVASLLLLADVVFQRRLVGNHLHPPPGPGAAAVAGHGAPRAGNVTAEAADEGGDEAPRPRKGLLEGGLSNLNLGQEDAGQDKRSKKTSARFCLSPVQGAVIQTESMAWPCWAKATVDKRHVCCQRPTTCTSAFAEARRKSGGQWVGVRATHGVVKSGRWAFCVWNESGGNLRVGWSCAQASLKLGTDKWSFGYGGTATKSHAGQFTKYGQTFGQADAITCCVDLDRRAITYMKNGREIPGDAFNLSKDLHGWALFPHVYTKEATFSVSFDGRGGAPPLVGGYQWLAQAEKDCLMSYWQICEEDLEDGAASTSGGFVLTAYGWRNAAEVGVPEPRITRASYVMVSACFKNSVSSLPQCVLIQFFEQSQKVVVLGTRPPKQQMVSGAYAPLTQSAAQTGLSMNCCQILAVILVNVLALPLQILALPFQLLFILLMPMVSFCSALSLRRRAATIDGRAEDPLVAQTWGSLEELLSRPAVTVDVSATWPMVVLAALMLPMILVNNMLAIWIPPYFAHIARMAKWHQLSATGCGKVLFSWYYWNWHLLFGTLIAYMGPRRVSVYAFEGEAQGAGDYWWHGQGYFTGTHALVDQLAMGVQDRGLGRAAFDAAIPEVFPLDSIIFLPNGHEATSKWAETRKVMHDFWLSEQGPNYAQRVGHLKGLLKESWSNPSLDNLANIKVASVLVSRCVFYVFFGHWLKDEEANVMSRWARDAPLLVTPRFMHRLMFNFFVHQCKDLRAETIALISKHKLGHVFSTMNSTFSSANRRKHDIDLCNELMFAIGFAGIGGPSRAAASVAKFLLAQQSEDQAGVTFGGANSHLMIALYKKDPKAFIMETCRISSPVGTFTTRLTASAAKELGLGLDLGTAQETHLAGVINVSNVDPRKFPEPHKFDPSRPNLPDALTWNGKAFSSRECDYPRLCPGREFSIRIVKTLTEVALEGTGS
eukprot:s5429_g1.t1